MLSDSLKRHSEHEERLDALEALKHRAIGVFAVLALVFTMAWEFIKGIMGRSS